MGTATNNSATHSTSETTMWQAVEEYADKNWHSFDEDGHSLEDPRCFSDNLFLRLEKIRDNAYEY